MLDQYQEVAECFEGAVGSIFQGKLDLKRSPQGMDILLARLAGGQTIRLCAQLSGEGLEVGISHELAGGGGGACPNEGGVSKIFCLDAPIPEINGAMESHIRTVMWEYLRLVLDLAMQDIFGDNHVDKAQRYRFCPIAEAVMTYLGDD